MLSSDISSPCQTVRNCVTHASYGGLAIDTDGTLLIVY